MAELVQARTQQLSAVNELRDKYESKINELTSKLQLAESECTRLKQTHYQEKTDTLKWLTWYGKQIDAERRKEQQSNLLMQKNSR
jgi:hypothetical protein